MQSVRADAPWCPSNIEFIRRINGLDSIDDVQRIVFDASYLVLGLGDVYLGAPVATPLDPRHRLVTTKYNPARTWTPENAVGIGGAYLCVYGMEGPGGYQFVGRTVPDVEPLSRRRASSATGKPWLLRFFDQIRFYPGQRARSCSSSATRFRAGGSRLQIEETTFRFARLPRVPATTTRRRSTRSRRASRRRSTPSASAGRALPPPPEAVADAPAAAEDALPPGAIAVRAAGHGSVWQIAVPAGTRVAAGDRLVVLETMKMETPVLAPAAGVVVAVCCAPGALVRPGQTLMGLRVDA